MKSVMKQLLKIISIFISVVIIIGIYLAADFKHFLKFATDMNENCQSLNELGNYLDYDMLINDLKHQIDESDFNFSSDRALYTLCSKYQDLEYHYDGYQQIVFPTCKMGRIYDVLIKDIEIDGTEYTVCIDFSIKPGLFFNTEIVDIDTGISLKTT